MRYNVSPSKNKNFYNFPIKNFVSLKYVREHLSMIMIKIKLMIK